MPIQWTVDTETGIIGWQWVASDGSREFCFFTLSFVHGVCN
jgi:hypothetical protein